ncbi:MAG: hypothetical protein K0U78_02755 [Actinomycetia bacterium]|nr:hypothetical protein [Actinomycetes bacterium]
MFNEGGHFMSALNTFLLCCLFSFVAFIHFDRTLNLWSKIDEHENKLENINVKLQATLVELATCETKNEINGGSSFVDKRRHIDDIMLKLTQCNTKMEDIQFKNTNLDKCNSENTKMMKELIHCRTEKETIERYEETGQLNKCGDMMNKVSNANERCEAVHSMTVSHLEKEIVRLEHEKTEASLTVKECKNDLANTYEFAIALQLELRYCNWTSTDRGVETV